MNIFRSHFYTLLIYALIVAPVIAMVRYQDRRLIVRYGIKLFLFMVGGVIVASWVMHLV